MSSPFTAVTGSVRVDIWMDCPAQHIWKCAFEFPNWAPTIKRADLVSGEWDQEGGVVLITKHDHIKMDHFFSTNLKIRPYKQQVYRIDSKGSDQVHGYVDVTLVETNGKTQVTYSNYLTYRFEVPLLFENIQGEVADEALQASYLRPFKKYAESTWK